MTSARKQILEEAENIGQAILSKVKDDNGLYWETLYMNTNREHVWEVSESIYGGCAGISIFLLELFKHTGKEVYYQTALSALLRLARICKEEEAKSQAFFTGRIGVSYAFLKLYDLSKDKEHLKIAGDIAKSGIGCINTDHHVDDLINGSSGVLLALLHLHSYIGERWIEEDIRKIANHLVDRASTAKSGLYWDKTFQQIHGLCGFSHGVAGLGFVFLELGNYFNDDVCYEIARLAFQYESKWFVPALSNWQDLRKSFYDPEDLIKAKNDFLSGNLTGFVRGGDMNAWCHGAAGIGLSRLEAVKLLKDGKYAGQLKKAIKKVLDTDVNGVAAQPSYTLCHGVGGNMDILIEATGYDNILEKMALRSIDIHKNVGTYLSGFGTGGSKEDISLFMGTAGVGYFMLRVLDPQKTSSILAPVVRKSESPATKRLKIFTTDQLKRQLLQKDYPQTIGLLETYEKQVLKELLPLLRFQSLTGDFSSKLKTCLNEMNKQHSLLIKDRFRLETQQMKLQQSTVSRALLFVKYSLQMENLAEVENNIPERTFQLNGNVVMVKTRYMHIKPGKAVSKIKPQTSMVMLKNTHNGVMADELSDFSYWVLAEFGKPKSFKAALQNLQQDFGATTNEEKQQVEYAFTEQIRQAFKSQVLVLAE